MEGHPVLSNELVSIPFKREGLPELLSKFRLFFECWGVSIPFKREGLPERNE